MKSRVIHFLILIAVTTVSCRQYQTREERAWEYVQNLRKLSIEEKRRFFEGKWFGAIYSGIRDYDSYYYSDASRLTFVDSIISLTFGSDKRWNILVKGERASGEWSLQHGTSGDFHLILESNPNIQGLGETIFEGTFTEQGASLTRVRYFIPNARQTYRLTYTWELVKETTE